MIVVVAPGQGSQTPGFLAPWLELDGVAERIADFSRITGLDLAAAGTEWDADTIRDTAVAQPLLEAAALVTARALAARTTAPFGGVAGHSVGEIAAASIAGILTPEDAMALVAERGRAMADAAALEPTGMAAVLGGDEEELLDLLESLGLEPANRNGGGQIVAAGALARIEALAAAPSAGSRVVPLQVAGAFHTRFMAPAVERLAALAATTHAGDPRLPIWTNRDGSRVDGGRRFLDLVVGQVASPVRWDLCEQSFLDAGITGLIELAPGGTLVGLAKRAYKGLEPPIRTVAIKTPDDLDAAVQLLEEDAA